MRRKGDCMSRQRGLSLIYSDTTPHMPNRAEMLEYIGAMAGELSTLADRAGAETLSALLDLARREAEQEEARYGDAPNRAP